MYSVAGQAGRTTLTDTHGWKIDDGGLTGGRLTPAPIPTIDDRTPRVGQNLTADPGVWGPAPVTLAYQWYRVDTHGKVHPIRWATGTTIRVSNADAGCRLKVTVTGSKPEYTTRSRTSKLTARVPTVRVDGTPRIGKIVTAVIVDTDPPSHLFRYQWYRGRTAIKGATKFRYTLAAKDKGRQVKVRVKTYRNGHYTTTRYGLVPGLVRSGLIAITPKLSDVTPVVGEAISITPKTAITAWAPQPVMAGYQWYRGLNPIAGATTGSYTVTDADLGTKLKVAITGSKHDYATITRKSSSSHPVT